MRGTRLRAGLRGVYRRFIPAGAGNRPRAGRRRSSPVVHPRWRGEQTIIAPKLSVIVGSSPLARGTADPTRLFGSENRFIPAGAGNRVSMPPARSTSAVHPRWRGEQTATELGNSSAGVHPHWRGEQPIRPAWPGDRAGSSPLARGTAMPRKPPGRRCRFIPAGAGNRLAAFLNLT